MAKVKLHKEVIKKIEEINKLYDVKTPLEKTVRLPYYYYNTWSGYQDFLNKYNITTETVKLAFENGWEEEYIFQIGDIVTVEHTGSIYKVVEKVNIERLDEITLQKIAQNKQLYTLLCKAENCEKY